MNEKDFVVTIEVGASAHEVFNAVTRDVAKWWGGDDLGGSTMKVDDEFVIHHPGTHFSRQKLTEIIPDQKVVWQVIESELSWLTKDPLEWTNTKMIFEMFPKGGKTDLRFTHEGLTPDKECYERVSGGWNTVIKGRLFHIINIDGTLQT